MNVETLQRRLARQKAKVGALEKIIEDKTRALFLANEELREANTTLEQRVQERTAELAEALRLAEAASQAKSDFLAQMSHELRTPLHGLIGTVDALGRTPLDAHQQRLTDRAQRSGQHLLSVIGDILDFSRLEKGQMELESLPTDAAALTREIAEMFASSATDKELDLDIRLPAAPPPPVLGDPHRLRQVFSNLIGNAIKFTAEGEVLFRLRARPSAETVVLVWTVSDTGIGIATEAFERIFEPFTQAESATTRHFGGTGLGLPISRRIVHTMGGTMEVASEIGRGTSFTVTLELPVAEAAASAPAADEPAPEPVAGGPLAGVPILLVDDNPVNRMVGSEMLAALGCTVFLAEDSARAIAAVQDSAPALILMDCHMPGVTGIETARLLRQQGYSAPIVALTADVSKKNRDAVAEAGMEELMGKPYRLRELEVVLSRHLDSATPAPPADAPRAPAAAPAAEPLLDEQQALEAVGGRAAFVTRLQGVFLEQLPVSLEQLSEAVRSGDPEAQRERAHSLKGAAATIYAQRLRTLAAKMEDAGAEGRCTPDDLPALLTIAEETAAVLRQRQAA